MKRLLKSLRTKLKVGRSHCNRLHYVIKIAPGPKLLEDCEEKHEKFARLGLYKDGAKQIITGEPEQKVLPSEPEESQGYIPSQEDTDDEKSTGISVISGCVSYSSFLMAEIHKEFDDIIRGTGSVFEKEIAERIKKNKELKYLLKKLTPRQLADKVRTEKKKFGKREAENGKSDVITSLDLC